MSTDQLLGLLVAERDKLNRAIEALHGSIKGRGRPSKWMETAKEELVEAATFSTKRRVSAAARKRMAQAQKKRWAAIKAKKSGQG